MHGTIAVLMALSGMGCHHKSCDVVPTTACYTATYNSCYTAPVVMNGCYSSACYSAPVYDSCYSSATYTAPVYDSCYSSACYTPTVHRARRGGGLFGGLFSCFKKRHAVVDSCYSSCYSAPVYDSCYSGGYSASMPVYGDFTPAMSGQVISTGSIYGGDVIYGSTQGAYGSVQGGSYVAPAAATPEPPAVSGDAATGDVAPPPPVPSAEVDAPAASDLTTPPAVPNPADVLPDAPAVPSVPGIEAPPAPATP